MNADASKLNRSLWLDAVRGMAVLMVFIYHCSEDDFIGTLASGYLKFIADIGMFGVDLFYVLSGFFITKTILKSKEWDVGKFYLQEQQEYIQRTWFVCL